jgi:hypothetical protein
MIERAAGLVVVAVTVAATLSCQPGPKPKNPDRMIGKGAERVDPSLLPKRTDVDPKYPPNAPSFPVASVPDKSVGPFLTRRHDGAMAAYLGPAEGSPRRVIALPLGSDGSPFDPQVVAPVSADAATLVVRPSGEQGAYVAAWTDLVERGESINVMGLSSLGKPRARPTEVARTQDNVVWIEIVPTAHGELMFWAEETQAAGANVFLVPLAADGQPHGMPSAVVRNVTSWQAVASAVGGGLVFVTQKPGKGEGAKPTSTITWRAFDDEGRSLGAPLTLDTSEKKVSDIDVANVAGTLVFAWTRRGAPEPEVMVAGLDAQGKLTPPRSISARSGGAALVDAVGGPHGGILAWQETTHLARGTRRLHLVPLPETQPLPDARPGASDEGVLEVDTSGAPELAPLEHGYAVLARVRTCPAPAIAGIECDDPTPSPTYIRLDERLTVRETLPLFVGDTQERATLGWGLACDKSDCLALVAGASTPAEVRAVRLGSGANHWRAPLPIPPPEGAPTVQAVDTIGSSDVYSELAVTDVGDTPMLAAIATEAPATASGVVGAPVTVTSLDRTTGVARAAANSVTRRALTEGGVSIAAAEGVPGGVVGWVGRDNGHSAVHLTRVDAAGKRIKEIQLTTAPADTSDVAVAWAGGGWVVAWVDTRDGNGEVYATKVDADLRRVAREVRITNAPGDASDVTVLGVPGKDGPGVWIAWADPRDSVKDGAADIFVARVKGLDATVDVPEQRVLATVPHSRSPALAMGEGSRTGAGGPCIAWIEEAPAGADPAGATVYGALVGALDANGHLIGETARTRGAGDGFPTSVALERIGSRLHMVLTRSSKDDVFLDGMTVAPGVPTRPFTLFGLEGPPSMDVSLAVLGSGVYFNDQSEGGAEGRIRRATVEWK